MNCRRCGAELEPDALGCPVCGEPVAPESFELAFTAPGKGHGGADGGFPDEADAGFSDGADAGEGRGALDGADEDEAPADADADAGDVAKDAPGADGGGASGKARAEEGEAPEKAGSGKPDGEAKGADDWLAGAFTPSAGSGRMAPELLIPDEKLVPLGQTPYIAYDAGEMHRLAEELPVLDAGEMPDGAYEQRHSRLFVTLVALLLVAALVAIASIWAYNTHLVVKSSVRYTVVYETNGGSRIDAQEVKTGSIIVAPRNPTISGRYFAGWYTDTTYQTQVTFPLEVDHDMTLYARWTRDKDKADKALAAQGSTQGETQGESAATGQGEATDS